MPVNFRRLNVRSKEMIINKTSGSVKSSSANIIQPIYH